MTTQPVNKARLQEEAMRLLAEKVGPYFARRASRLRGYKSEGVKLFLARQYEDAVPTLTREVYKYDGEKIQIWLSLLESVASTLAYRHAGTFEVRRRLLQKANDKEGVAWAFLAEALTDIVTEYGKTLYTNLAGAARCAKSAGASGKEVLAILQQLKELGLEIEGV